MEKAREFQKNIYFCFIDYAKAFDCVDHNKLWKILWTEEPGRLQSMGSQTVRYNWAVHFHLWEFTSYGKHRACPSTHTQRYSTYCVSVVWRLYLSTTSNTHSDFPSAVSCIGNAEGLLLPKEFVSLALPWPGSLSPLRDMNVFCGC